MPHQCLQCGRTFADGAKELLKGCPGCQGTRFFFTQKPLDEQQRATLLERTNHDMRKVIQELLLAGKPDYKDDIWTQKRWKEWIAVSKTGTLPTLAEYVQAVGDTDGPRRSDEALARDAGDEATRATSGLTTATATPMTLTDAVPAAPPSPVAAAPSPLREPTSPPSPASPASRLAIREIDEIVPASEPAPSPPPPPPLAAPGPPAPPPAVSAVSAVPAVPAASAAKAETITIVEPGRYEIDLEGLLKAAPIIVQNDGVYMVHLPSVFAAMKGGTPRATKGRARR